MEDLLLELVRSATALCICGCVALVAWVCFKTLYYFIDLYRVESNKMTDSDRLKAICDRLNIKDGD